MDILSNFFGDIQIQGYTKEMTKEFIPTAIVFGIFIAAFLIFAAFAAKKGYVCGIFAGITTFAATVLAPKYVEVFHMMEAVKYVYGYSQEELDAKIADYYTSLIPMYCIMLLFSLCLILALVFNIILSVKMMKVNYKLFGMFALIITIVRYLLVSPVPLISSLINGGATMQGQKTQLILFYLSLLVPALLNAVGSLLTMLKRRAAPATALEAAEPATDVAAEPAVEVAVEEAPAVEAVAEEAAEPTVEAEAEEEVKPTAEV